MTAHRRTVLKLAVLGGGVLIGAPCLSGAAGASAPAPRLVPLVGGSPSDAAFTAGINDAAREAGGTALAVLRLPPGDPIALFDLESRLSVLTGSVLVGLLDEARYMIFAEMVRGRGGLLRHTGRPALPGEAAARLAAGLWTPHQADSYRAAAPTWNARNTTGLVSFVIQM